MLVMMICCISAVSATDINGTDDHTDNIAVDEISEVVEDVEIDDVSEDVVGEECACTGANSITIDNNNYTSYFSNGWTTTNNNLTFVGNFDAKTFGNFKINSPIVINACGATFTNVGFDLKVSNITLCGGKFIGDETTNLTSVISSSADHSTIKGVTINVTAPENKDFYAINLVNSEKSQVLNNKIYYTDLYKNQLNYNYVIKAIDSANVLIDGNKINANIPIKRVNYTRSGLNSDMVAGVAVYNCNYLNFTNNNLTTEITNISDIYPTLSAFLILDSNHAKVAGNKIIMKDEKTGENDTNYLYAIDVYRCNNIVIDNNTIKINSDGGQIIINGTGAAYGVQLTGPHTGVVVSSNVITTANNGPNLGIYSQNYEGATNINITGNTINVTGRAGNHPWALVSGMELQDDYAYVYGNDITVNNLAGNDTSLCAYGISYSQWTDYDHVYDVYNNTVRLYNGTYAVFMTDSTVGSHIMNNTLSTTYNSGDNAVSIDRSYNQVSGNN